MILFVKIMFPFALLDGKEVFVVRRSRHGSVAHKIIPFIQGLIAILWARSAGSGGAVISGNETRNRKEKDFFWVSFFLSLPSVSILFLDPRTQFLLS